MHSQEGRPDLSQVQALLLYCGGIVMVAVLWNLGFSAASLPGRS